MSELKKIDDDYYFRLNDIFSIWLMKKQNAHFKDLSYKDGKKKFKNFVKGTIIKNSIHYIMNTIN
ncbi:unnamed protein product (macronuclear) [Paramecium tetraurelia]|uniref:Uncharacterized protein n=1 Tax=Paramecium tetraurelia TaxID=5888 RepID=A0CE53_PARTE|nr:uncharacterized protein GSPATT00037506001 [Paramecium tetraurelia]CAK69070.1 unnamed protein product [Paramecium tetraurelia]|eukprot:XP_001436467.1 hypothetical protein (macronuclear) [Paramecium tetraurelia strain d4-2]